MRTEYKYLLWNQEGGVLLLTLNRPEKHNALNLELRNELDAELADYIAFMCNEPNTRVIAAFVEGIRNPDKFLEACEYTLSKGKPIIALKIGRSAEGVTHKSDAGGSPSETPGC